MSSADFYPRPPRGGRPAPPFTCLPVLTSFLSTPSARRATVPCHDRASRRRNFYPRPPRGGRLAISVVIAAINAISIHALREEGDDAETAKTIDSLNFYPRPPRGGRRMRSLYKFSGLPISIHALREEGDLTTGDRHEVTEDFYPRPPRGGRHARELADHAELLFLSTPSARRATHQTGCGFQPRHISIHALREEGDPQRGCRCVNKLYFYPRPPRGGRPTDFALPSCRSLFLSTPSARRAT